MIVFGAPSRYVQGPGALARIGEEAKSLGRSALIIIDPMLKDSLGAEIAAHCKAALESAALLAFGGESSPSEVARLRSLASAAEVVIAVGGGKCIDAGKAIARELSARLITVPTIASNDSPTSHIFVLYDDDHRLLSVEKLARNPDTVLVDTAIIARAPAMFLRSGIGDALVKKYEVEQCVAVGGWNVFDSRPSFAALAMARSCYDILQADAAAALAAVERRSPDEALERIVEACVLMSGLSFENGGLCIAHAMTRGLSAVKEVAGAPHGFQVVYGVTVQLVLEGRDAAFMAEHAAFCREVGLPFTLRALGLREPSAEQLDLIAELTLKAPHLRNFQRPVSKPDFIAAMRETEALAGLAQAMP